MSENNQLSEWGNDSRNRIVDLIDASRNLCPDARLTIESEVEGFAEYEFGYYAELSKAKNVGEFKNKILSIVERFGFSDFSFMRLHCGDIDSKLLITTPNDMLVSYFGQDFMKYDMMLPYAEQKLEPVYCSRISDYADGSPFQNETTVSTVLSAK